MGDGLNLLKGTVELLILRALRDGPRHGYGVAQWIEGATGGELLLEEGTLYPALHRLQRKGLVTGEWGASENNRRARFYELTAAGRKVLGREASEWEAYAGAVLRALGPRPEEG